MTDDLKAYLKGKVDENIHLIPEHMRDAVYGYVLDRIEPGSFLLSVLENDLCGAIARADHINKAAIVQWAEFMMWTMPMAARGSKENVAAWLRGE